MASMSKSGIQYADYSWNPTTGCAPGLPCAARCWAASMHRRFHPEQDFWQAQEHPDRLDAPLRTRKPGVVAVSFGGDLFAEGVSWEFQAAVFGAMAAAPRHTFLVLTKRPERMLAWAGWMWDQEPVFDPDNPTPTGPAVHAAYCLLMQEVKHHPDVDGGPIHCKFGPAPESVWPPPNVLLGVSVSNQAEANERIPVLMRLSQAGWRTWVSVEPMLGPVDLQKCWEEEKHGAYLRDVLTGFCAHGCGGWHVPPLSWVVCGGESGPGARPTHPEWVIALRDQCVAAEVPFFFKQWGTWWPQCDYYHPDDDIRDDRLDGPHILLTRSGRRHNPEIDGQPPVGTHIMANNRASHAFAVCGFHMKATGAVVEVPCLAFDSWQWTEMPAEASR